MNWLLSSSLENHSLSVDDNSSVVFWMAWGCTVKVGNSMSDSAWGKMSHGSNLLTARGFEGLYKQHFGLAPNEQLLKTYACYLSASTGPIPGTLYVTNQKFAFCSDRPISYAPTPGQQASSHYKVHGGCLPSGLFTLCLQSCEMTVVASRAFSMVSADHSFCLKE